jgi:hypothetical protein
MNIVAAWRPDVRTYSSKANAQLVAEEIMSIGESATPEQIYEKAKGEDTELHKCLEWDDKKAADLYRIRQCGDIVRQLIIRKKDEPEQSKEPIRFFYRSDIQGGYTPTVKIIRNVDEYQALLEQAKRELRIFKSKYNCLNELREILDLID